jgi:hypothetical protein
LNNPKAQSKYLLPAKFNQNTRAFRKYTLSPIFERAAQSQGFNVTMKGWEQQYNKIRFICRRGRFAQLKKEEAGTSPTTTDNDYRIPLSTHRKRKKKKKGNKSKAKNTPVQRKKAVNTTGMPVKGLSEKCPFQFCVYWDPNINRWFLPAEQQGSLQHCGHLWCQPELVSLPVKALPRDEIIMASDGTKEFMKASMLEALLFRRNATTIPTQKLKYFQSCQKRMAENPMLSFLRTGEQSHDANLPTPSTPADLILADLDADPSSSYYVAMYGKYDSELLIKKHESYPGIPACGLDVLPQQTYHPDIGTHYFVSTLGSSRVKLTGHWATKGGEDTLQVVLQRLNRGDAWTNNDVSLSQTQQELQNQEEENDNPGFMDWSGSNSDSENEAAGFTNSNTEDMLESAVPGVTIAQFNQVARARREWKSDAHNAFKSKVEDINKLLSSSEATDEMWVQANKVLDTLNFDLTVKLQAKEDNSNGVSQGILSLPNNVNHRNKSSARTKRVTEK